MAKYIKYAELRLNQKSKGKDAVFTHTTFCILSDDIKDSLALSKKSTDFK